MGFAGLITAMLAPHDRKNPQFGMGGPAPQNGPNPAILIGAEAIFTGQLEVDLGIAGMGLDLHGGTRLHGVARASRALSKRIRPSVPPKTASAARSGWGIMPRTLPCALMTPAMWAKEPLGLNASPKAPSG